MSVMGVVEVAEELGVSSRRVRQMLAEGDLRGERVGRAWIVERGALDQALANRPEVGRPWRASAAWAFLALAQGRDVELSAVDRLRIQRRVDDGAEVNLGRLRARSGERMFYAHPSALERILQQPGLVRSGISAVDAHSIDLVAPEAAEGYVRHSDVGGLIERFALDESSDRPNVILRIVDDDVWPFDAGQSVAPAVVVAVDLLESTNERSRRAGRILLDGL